MDNISKDYCIHQGNFYRSRLLLKESDIVDYF